VSASTVFMVNVPAMPAPLPCWVEMVAAPATAMMRVLTPSDDAVTTALATSASSVSVSVEQVAVQRQLGGRDVGHRELAVVVLRAGDVDLHARPEAVGQPVAGRAGDGVLAAGHRVEGQRRVARSWPRRPRSRGCRRRRWSR
jgi:hypothetical protein